MNGYMVDKPLSNIRHVTQVLPGEGVEIVRDPAAGPAGGVNILRFKVLGILEASHFVERRSYVWDFEDRYRS